VIDLHCHLLPGIDDGVATTEEALALARELATVGVRTVAATPHLRDDHPAVRPEELAERGADVAEEVRSAGIDIEVLPAAEIDLVRALEASDEELRLASYGQRGTDILLEAPYGPLSAVFEEQLFRIALRGVRILLAHPERNPTFQRDRPRLAELVRRGVLLQVTASSLLPRRHRSPTGELARALVSDGLAHAIASDAHGPRDRGPDLLRDGVAEARSLLGAGADWLVEDAPRAILAGEALPARPPGGRPGASRIRRLLPRR
jgi:protein-tyrosine phosphatase